MSWLVVALALAVSPKEREAAPPATCEQRCEKSPKPCSEACEKNMPKDKLAGCKQACTASVPVCKEQCKKGASNE